MKKISVLLIAILITNRLYAQSVSSEYNYLIIVADSLHKLKDYKASAFKYSAAFKTLGGKGFPDDRYKAACVWAMAGYADSAFFNLQRIAFKSFFSDYERLMTDKELMVLHGLKQWEPLLERVKHNQDSITAKMDKRLIKKLDSLVNEDQKWRGLSRRFDNNVVPKDSIERFKISRNIGKTDSLNYNAIKEIFYKYGFPNYDLVGEGGSSNFWLLVQHQDRHFLFQDSVLALMKIEAEKGKASWINYAYLVDRVKVNAGEKQIYGTQMQMNSDSTSFEPKPLLFPEKINERRKSVGLGTIEDYTAVMNSRYHGSLKNK